MAEKRERCIEYKSDSIHCSIRLAKKNECVYHYVRTLCKECHKLTDSYGGKALKLTRGELL